MPELTDWLASTASSPWIFPTVFVLVIADAFFVIVPSEVAVVALGALSFSTGSPNARILVAVAALGATIGDNLCYLIGRKMGTTRFAWMRRPRLQRAFARARHALDRRAATVLLTARYIPFARIATNLAAGATGFPYRRFLPLSAVAGLCWAVYKVSIGGLFGTWLGESPVLSVAISIVVAITLGITIDAVVSRVTHASEPSAPAPQQKRATTRR